MDVVSRGWADLSSAVLGEPWLNQSAVTVSPSVANRKCRASLCEQSGMQTVNIHFGLPGSLETLTAPRASQQSTSEAESTPRALYRQCQRLLASALLILPLSGAAGAGRPLRQAAGEKTFFFPNSGTSLCLTHPQQIKSNLLYC